MTHIANTVASVFFDSVCLCGQLMVVSYESNCVGTRMRESVPPLLKSQKQKHLKTYIT
jgi:hypothetical protein